MVTLLAEGGAAAQNGFHGEPAGIQVEVELEPQPRRFSWDWGIPAGSTPGPGTTWAGRWWPSRGGVGDSPGQEKPGVRLGPGQGRGGDRHPGPTHHLYETERPGGVLSCPISSSPRQIWWWCTTTWTCPCGGSRSSIGAVPGATGGFWPSSPLQYRGISPGQAGHRPAANEDAHGELRFVPFSGGGGGKRGATRRTGR